MKTLLLITISSLLMSSFAFADEETYEDVYIDVAKCIVTKVLTLREYEVKPVYKIKLKKGMKVIVSDFKAERGNYDIRFGSQYLSTLDDDYVAKRDTLAGVSYSMVPNSGNTVFILDIYKKDAILSFMNKNDGSRGPFTNLAKLRCKTLE